MTDLDHTEISMSIPNGDFFSSLLEFVWYELTTFSGYGLSKLKATTNVSDATVVFETDFEGCGTCLQSQRISYAQAVLAAYGSTPYAAAFVSQSFPYATKTMQMMAGDVVPSYIELKNAGTKAWDSNTRIGTTMPRDRKSVFADSSWLAPNRPAAVKGTVAPGGTYKFEFNLAAPDTAGTYDEHFGVVEEGVAWFSDSGQGGPPDNQLEVKIQVAPGPPKPDAGTTKDGGAAEDAGIITKDSGAPVVGDTEEPGSSAGCSVGSGGKSASPWSSLALVALVVGQLRRRRRVRS